VSTPETKSQTRRSATELALHRLTHQTEPDTYEESIYGTISRLCPKGFDDLMALVIHYADAMAAVLERECGSKEAAAASLEQQLAELVRSNP
jgi:hypothetical protein